MQILIPTDKIHKFSEQTKKIFGLRTLGQITQQRNDVSFDSEPRGLVIHTTGPMEEILKASAGCLNEVFIYSDQNLLGIINGEMVCVIDRTKVMSFMDNLFKDHAGTLPTLIGIHDAMDKAIATRIQ